MGPIKSIAACAGCPFAINAVVETPIMMPIGPIMVVGFVTEEISICGRKLEILELLNAIGFRAAQRSPFHPMPFDFDITNDDSCDNVAEDGLLEFNTTVGMMGVGVYSHDRDMIFMQRGRSMVGGSIGVPPGASLADRLDRMQGAL